MRIKKNILLAGCLVWGSLCVAQGLDNVWTMGTDGDNPYPFGGGDIYFSLSSVLQDTNQRPIDFSATAASLSDEQGNLLMYTNGSVVFNAQHDTMVNGAGLNPSLFFSGPLNIPQSHLFLPDPGGGSLVYLIHKNIDTLDAGGGYFCNYLYFSIVDATAYNGVGGILLKNQILLNEEINYGSITSVRHANGRDWWIFCRKHASDEFIRFLLTPDGFSAPFYQAIGVVRTGAGPETVFSEDGSRFAINEGIHGMDLMDFDRCTGLFSNARHIDPDVEFSFVGGVTFSPNGDWLFCDYADTLFQFDWNAVDVAASATVVATWDSIYDPTGPPFAALFGRGLLAPNGKIYNHNLNGTRYLHSIENPDVWGVGCNVTQPGLVLDFLNFRAIPNHINYHLGPLAGSICDSLGLSIMEPPLNLNMSLFPNPNSGAFRISFAAQPEAGECVLLDASGKVLYQERIAPWSTIKILDQELSSGLYQCSVRFKDQHASLRFVVQ